MAEIMKSQVELALQNRNAPVSSQAEPAAASAAVSLRSKAEKLQDAMEAEALRRAQQMHDDRKRKFNSLDADAKEVTGGCCARRATLSCLTSCAEEEMEAYRMHNQRSFDPMAAFLGGGDDVSAADTP